MGAFYRTKGKRILDICCVVPGLVFLSPFLLLTGILNRIIHGNPVLYRGARIGRNGKQFTMYKFRTMKDLRDQNGNLLEDDERLTRFGNLLRASSLDELPELYNVLVGDMSLVGPRPLLPEYTERYDPVQIRRLEVEQGVTGWSQIHGRNALEWDEKFRYDVWYVDNISLRVDLKIIALTFWKIIQREGVAHEGSVNMPEFLGNVKRPLNSPAQQEKMQSAVKQ